MFPDTLRMTSEDRSLFKSRPQPMKCWDKFYEELSVMIPYDQVRIYVEDFLTNRELACFARSLLVSFIAYPSVLNRVLVTKPALKSIKLELVVKLSGSVGGFFLFCFFFFFIQN